MEKAVTVSLVVVAMSSVSVVLYVVEVSEWLCCLLFLLFVSASMVQTEDRVSVRPLLWRGNAL